MNEQTIPIDEVRIDGGTQPRQSLDEETIQQYAQQMIEGEAFPPVTVYQDGADLWLADGFHRYHAVRKSNRTEIAADVRPGTRRDAILFSVGANAAHGLRRTNTDKRKAVTTLLSDEEWQRFSDREIGRRCAVDHVFVGKLRRELSGDRHQIASPSAQIQGSSQRPPGQVRTVARGDSVYQQDTTNIGRKHAPQRAGTPRISPKAMAPVLGHSDPIPRTALDLPHDPVLAAKAMVELFEEDFLVQLVDELSNLLAGAPA